MANSRNPVRKVVFCELSTAEQNNRETGSEQNIKHIDESHLKHADTVDSIKCYLLNLLEDSGMQS
jgi:hypothetical protein